MLEALMPLIGREHPFAAVCAELRSLARASGATAFGALHVTCSDESEFECGDAFRRDFTQELLPRLKYGSHVPFHISNPGARYEWGSMQVVQAHFATRAARRGWLLVIAKVNTHVAVTQSGRDGVKFGLMDRYGDKSTYCGAIHATLAGAHLPFAHALADELRSDGLDRLALLRDEAVVPTRLASLYGAIVAARIHARRIAQDIQDLDDDPSGAPVVHLVLHGVTLNHPGPDTELIGGAYVLDRRGERPRDVYCGLGDDPREYVYAEVGGKVRVTGPGIDAPRAARDHRRLAAETLAGMDHPLAHAQAKAAVAAARSSGPERATAAAILEPALVTLAEVATLPTALFLYAEGLVGVHHAVRLHNAGTHADREEAARDVVADFEARLDELSPEDAHRILDRLQATQR
ncbi:MAG: hypothetical protein QNJ98_09185 [Planctomycetota bacterium]|nr:hypothetical protein [Planctomycetota bacterium]